MIAKEIKKGIYWVGAIDWSLRNFHGYTTDCGATYNAYLIMDEKITLIDTVKAAFADEMLARISSIVDPAKIDYIVSNHVEMDHSGAIPAIMKLATNAKIYTTFPQGQKGLTAHYGEYPYMPVKSGDTLNIGARNLKFVATPMLHWPDNMVTYLVEDNIVFSNDAFGQHYASSERYATAENIGDVMREAKKYYANIVMPFASQAASAANTVKHLNPAIIAPSHGAIFTESFVPHILDQYANWSSNEPDNAAVVVFDSMWHSTETIAKALCEAFIEHGIAAKLIDLKTTHISDIMTEVLSAKYICVGSPTLNNNMLPTVAAFLTYLSGLAPKNRKAFAFGSYGWSGQSIGQVEEKLLSCGFELFAEKLRVSYVPDAKTFSAIDELFKAALEK